MTSEFHVLGMFVLILWAASPHGRAAAALGFFLYQLGVFNERAYPGGRDTTRTEEAFVRLVLLVALHVLAQFVTVHRNRGYERETKP